MIVYNDNLLNQWKKFVLSHCRSVESIDAMIDRLNMNQVKQGSNIPNLLEFCRTLRNT